MGDDLCSKPRTGLDRRKFLVQAGTTAAAVLGPSIFSCPNIPAADNDSSRDTEIVLGMSAAFSGPSRGLGIELYRGAMAYLEHVNQAGGIEGRRVRIKAYDDGYNPIPAINNTVRLIEHDEPLLLFGYVGTPTVTRILPLLKIYEQRSIFLFFPFTGAQPHRQPPYEEFVFNLRASYHQETAGLVDHFIEVGRTRIAVFYQMDAYGRGGWEGVRIALAGRQLHVAGEATYQRGTRYQESLLPQVEILRKTEPQAVICVGAYAACAAFVRDARDAGWEVPIANISFVGSDSLLGLLRESSKKRGQDYTRQLINSQVVPSYNRTELAAVRQYRELMEKYKPQPPRELLTEDYRPFEHSYVGMEGFLNARLLVELLRRMGTSIERKNIREVVESSEELDLGIDVPVSFGPKKHQGMNQVYFKTIENGQFVPIKDWRQWEV